MPEELVTCPVCLTPNFTPRGLKAHKCKGGNRRNPQTGLVEVVPPLNPEPGKGSLVTAFHKPLGLQENIDSITQVTPATALARIKQVAANHDGYAPVQVRVILEDSLTREVRSVPQRRSVIQALKQAIKKLAQPPQKHLPKQRNGTLPDALHSPCIDVAEVVTDGVASASLAVVSPVAEINAFHRRATASAAQARESAAEACHYAVLCGVRLEQLKVATPHGEWGTLFAGRKNKNSKSNSAQNGECAEFEFSQDTAHRYMEVAKRIRLENRLSSKAVKRLGAIAEAADVDDKSRAWLNKLTEGQNLRQLYLNLEIVTKPAPKDKDKKPPGPTKSDEQLRIEDAREAFFVWREQWPKLVRRGHLDDLPQPELRELHEFLATCRDSTKSRLAKP